MSNTTAQHDHLKLSNDENCQKMLLKVGDNSNLPEIVLFSDFVLKKLIKEINHKIVYY